MAPRTASVVSLKAPGSSAWMEVLPLQEIRNEPGPDGVHISIFNDLYHPTTGGNYISVYLSPESQAEEFPRNSDGRVASTVARRGSPRRTLRRAGSNETIPMEIGVDGNRRFFRFPSFFSEKTNVDSHSITSLACGQT